MYFVEYWNDEFDEFVPVSASKDMRVNKFDTWAEASAFEAELHEGKFILGKSGDIPLTRIRYSSKGGKRRG